MTLHAENALPKDPAALAAMIAALRGELAEERAARRAAELGLQARTLEAERLRVQIARLRQERFGRSWVYREFRVWGRTMPLKEPSYATPQTAFDPG